MKPTQKLLLPLICAAALIGNEAQAGLQIPYTTNANTLHLWHFDGASTNANGSQNVLTSDAVSPGGITLTNEGVANGSGLLTNIDLGEASFSGLSNALHCIYIGSGAEFAYASGGTNQNATFPFVNPTTGAFTMESLVKMDVNPFTASGNWEVIAGDNQGLTGGRGWQFRIKSSSTTPQLELNSITTANGSFGDFLAYLPGTGLDAAVANQWYHFAVTYTGYTPTNGDPAGVLTFYWTLLDANRTFADAVTNFTIGTPGTLGGNPWISVGGSGRTQSGVGNGEGFKGFIDEARMSEVCLKSNQMAFVTGGALNPPSFTQQPATNSLVAYGKNLTLNALVSGTLPISYQWQFNNGGGYASLFGQTNNNLPLTGVTFASGGSYQLIATNNYGSKTSLVAQVTIGASPSELFNTGVDTNGVALDVSDPGSADPHYTLVQSADLSGLGPNAIVWSDGFPTAAGGGLFALNDPSSVWIGPLENASQVEGGYVYQITFVVDSANPATVALNGTWWMNTAALDIRLNGHSTGISDFASSPEKFASTFSITNGFVTGLNTLQFVVTNSTGDYNGFRAELNAVGQALPAGLPVITNQPASQTVRDNEAGSGSVAKFSVVALGRPPLSYQWVADGNAISGQTNRTLTFDSPDSLASPGTNFTVVVSNASGSVTSSVAVLTLVETDQPPVVLNYNLTVYSNLSVSFDLDQAYNAATDADGDPLTLSAYDTTTTNGVSLAQTGTVLTFTSPTIGADQFSYTISDALTTSQGFVNLNVLPLLPPSSFSASGSGGNVILRGSGGSVGGSYHVLSSTNLLTPLSSWTILSAGTFDNGGNLNITNAITPGVPQNFYIISVP